MVGTVHANMRIGKSRQYQLDREAMVKQQGKRCSYVPFTNYNPGPETGKCSSKAYPCPE